MKKKAILGLISLLCVGSTCLTSCMKDGVDGKDGINGVDGSAGADGKDGSQIYTGTGTPDSETGNIGDLYIDTESGDMYSKGESGWIKTGNIKGAKGNDGTNGKDGVSIKGVSKTSSAGNVDIYTITYSDGSTSSFTVTNGKDGQPGATGQKGDDGHTPTVTIGSNGNWYVDGQDTGYAAKGPKGDTGANGTDGVSIVSVVKTDTTGVIDTYTIYYSDNTTSTFNVHNGTDGKDGQDGHTPVVTIGSDGYWYVDNVNTGVKAKGDKGDTGNGISKVSKTSSEGNVDTYTITYTDGSTSTFTVTNGIDGKTPYIGENGHWWIGDTDTGVNAKGDDGAKGDKGDTGVTGAKGDKGDDGEKGDKGDTGVSVVGTHIDENGDLICEMSDGTTINAGHVKDVTKHNVNFYVDDEIVQTLSVSDGAKISAPSEEVTAGYTINYWNSKEDGGYRWLFSAYTVISDLDLYADFTYNDYTITYVDAKYNTKIDDQKVTYDKPYSLSTIENQTGWTFSGWKRDDGKLFKNSGTYRIAGNLNLNAYWVANQYKITLDPNKGSVSSTKITATYDSQYELPTPTRENYTFLGWYDKNDKKVSSKATWKQTEDVTYTAKWTNVQNTYSFDAGDGTCDVDSMVIGWEDPYTLPTPRPAEGYCFFGWYLDGKYIPLSGEKWTYSNVGGTLVAHFCTKDYAIQIGKIPNYLAITNTLAYGLYPQKHVSDASLISTLNALTTPESNGWYLYDGSYYAKASAKPYESSYKFDDGTTIVDGTTYWFKCEPITWKVLSSNDGTYSLVSTELLDVHCYCSSEDIRTIDGKTVYPNNYKNSDIRTWLNDTFYNTAFSLDDSYVQTVEVDNSASTTNSSTNTYACENTYDNVYLLSYQDYDNASYFADNASRRCKTTDWARANGASMCTETSYSGNGWYWTRSPYYFSSSSAGLVNYDGVNGYIYHYFSSYTSVSVDDSRYGVRPAITIKL